MASVATPFTGDKSKVELIDPGKYKYEGNYYTGTWDNATNWGSDYSKIGVGTPSGGAPAPNTGRPSNPNAPIDGPRGGNTDPWDVTHDNGPTQWGSGFPSANPYPGGTPGTIDWTRFLPQGPDNPPGRFTGAPVDRTNDAGTFAASAATTATRPPPPPGYTLDPNTGAWVWDGHSTMRQGPFDSVVSLASPTGQQTGGGGGDWIDQALALAESTDDPAYWRRVIAADPKVAAGDQSAIDYWRHRIAIGDGARAVREGRTQTFQDGGGAALPSGPMNYQQAVAYITQQIGRAPSQGEIAAQFAKRGGNESSTFYAQGLAPVIADLKGAGGSATPPPTTVAGPNHGYDDPNAQFYLNQIMERFNQLKNTPKDPWEDILKLFAMGRVNDLGVAPYTAGEDAALTAQYREPQTQARDAAKRAKAEELGRRGFTPDSPLFQGEMTKIDQAYQKGIASGSNNLGVRAVDEKQRRADEQLTILNSIMGVNRQGVDRQNAVSDQMLELAKRFPDFDATRLNQLLTASGNGSDTSGSISALTGLGGLNLNAQNLQRLMQDAANGNSQASAATWGQILGYIMGAL